MKGAAKGQMVSKLSWDLQAKAVPGGAAPSPAQHT